MTDRYLPPIFNIAQYCLESNGQNRGDKPGLILVGAEGELAYWTFGNLDKVVRAVAAGLTEMGFQRGDRILIRMANDVDYALMVFGAMAAGLVPIPSSIQLTDEEVGFILEDSGAAAVVISGGLTFDCIAPEGVQVISSADVERLKATPPAPSYADTKAEDPAFLIYTSGTTGKPKGVLHGHRSAWGRRPMLQDWMGLTEGDVMMHAGQFNWTYTLGVGLTDPWAAGASAVLYNGPKNPAIWPKLIERYQATIFATVPSLYRQIMKYGEPSQYDLSSLRHCLSAGEPLPAGLRKMWIDLTRVELYEALGMSEISTYISCGPEVTVKPGSPGKIQRNRRITLLPIDPAEGTDPVPQGQVGVLAVHRDEHGLMLGYWNRPEEEDLFFRGDWFITGDLAHQDGDGYIWYEGRNDEQINPMGYRVSPLEVEKALAHHASVQEVAVGELQVTEDVAIIAAYIVVKEGANLTRGEVFAYAADHLAEYKRPREVVFVEQLPRTPNGKIKRAALASLAKKRA